MLATPVSLDVGTSEVASPVVPPVVASPVVVVGLAISSGVHPRNHTNTMTPRRCRMGPACSDHPPIQAKCSGLIGSLQARPRDPEPRVPRRRRSLVAARDQPQPSLPRSTRSPPSSEPTCIAALMEPVEHLAHAEHGHLGARGLFGHGVAALNDDEGIREGSRGRCAGRRTRSRSRAYCRGQWHGIWPRSDRPRVPPCTSAVSGLWIVGRCEVRGTYSRPVITGRSCTAPCARVYADIPARVYSLQCPGQAHRRPQRASNRPIATRPSSRTAMSSRTDVGRGGCTGRSRPTKSHAPSAGPASCLGASVASFATRRSFSASADLSAEIRSALEQSRYLVVVCSPRTPASVWVNREVELFRELGRHDRILALLVEGEPRDSFPARYVRSVARSWIQRRVRWGSASRMSSRWPPMCAQARAVLPRSVVLRSCA